MSINVNFKWGKQVFENVPVDLSEPVETLKLQLFSLTQVPMERQKIMGVKGGVLKDDANLATLGLKEGQTLMLMGTADVALPPAEKIVFVEDLAPEEMQSMLMAGLPPGLTNLGNTCYMNSGIQCLNSVKEFATKLQTLGGAASDSDPSTRVAIATREIFRTLQTSKQAVAPFQFLLTLRSAYPQFAERGEDGNYAQQDAEECLTQILSSIARVPNGAKIIDSTFGVDLETTFTCVDDERDRSVEIERQTKLLCHIDANVSFLSEGMRRSMEGSVSKRSHLLEREAEFKKVSKISKLPPYLIIQEVRFDWRSDTQKRAKILRAVKFPFDLDLIDITTDSLKQLLIANRPALEEKRQKELAAKRAKKLPFTNPETGPADMEGVVTSSEISTEASASASASASAAASEIASEISVANDMGTGKYELMAVLTHQGRNADGGHYMAWVKEKEDTWHRFDDDRVSIVNDEEIKKLHGGGDWHMAYILLYKHLFP